jgi:hypothetical protein
MSVWQVANHWYILLANSDGGVGLVIELDDFGHAVLVVPHVGVGVTLDMLC